MSSVSIHEWRANQLPWADWLEADPIRPLIILDARRATLTDPGGERSAFRPTDYPGLSLLAARVGIPERVLRQLANGTTRRINVATADRYCCATGRHIRDLWPWYYGDPA